MPLKNPANVASLRAANDPGIDYGKVRVVAARLINAAQDNDEARATAALDELYDIIDEANRRLHEITQWCRAYPKTVFRDVTDEEMARVSQTLGAHGMRSIMDRMHAAWARHLLSGIENIAMGHVYPDRKAS